jgi:hypothetical protein
LLPLGSVLDFGVLNRLPLHVRCIISTAGTQGDDVIDHVARTAPLGLLSRWAWHNGAESANGFRIALDVLASVGRKCEDEEADE